MTTFYSFFEWGGVLVRQAMIVFDDVYAPQREFIAQLRQLGR
jgi:hypothetical protein